MTKLETVRNLPNTSSLLLIETEKLNLSLSSLDLPSQVQASVDLIAIQIQQETVKLIESLNFLKSIDLPSQAQASAELIASQMLPLSKDMVALSDEYKTSLEKLIENQATSIGQIESHLIDAGKLTVSARESAKAAAKSATAAADSALTASETATRSSKLFSLKVIALCLVSSTVSVLLATWLLPQKPIQNTLDPQAVAKLIEPALTATLQQSLQHGNGRRQR